MSLLRYICFIFGFYGIVLAAPVSKHVSGAEHIILLNNTHPDTPSLSRILDSLSLSPTHKDVTHIYNNSAFVGFAARMNTHCLAILANTTGVTHIEPAARVELASSSLSSLQGSPWGLQRLSTASTSIDGNTEELNYTYTYANPLLGQGANIYIIDTGIYTPHVVFGGRATMGWSFDGLDTDDDGHGTHVSGIAAGAPVGVAQGANLIGVRVLGADGGGSSSNVVKGVDWAVQQHTQAQSSGSSGSAGSILSLSLASSEPIAALTAALHAASSAGLHIVTAAGNNASNACMSSPSNTGGTQGPAIVVGSVGPDSATISSFSNTGPCVDVYAAGEGVVSAWPPLLDSSSSGTSNENNEIKSLDGTSMAAPFVTGLVAYAIAGNATLAASPGLMKEWVRMVALRGVVQSGSNENVVDGDVGLLASNGVVQVLKDREGFLGFSAGADGDDVSG